LEAVEANPVIFTNLRDSAGFAYSEYRCNAFGALAFTKQSVETIISEYEISITSSS
jgi:hypothetical protein